MTSKEKDQTHRSIFSVIFSRTLSLNLASVLLVVGSAFGEDPPINRQQQLALRVEIGKQIFLDTNLSQPKGQACVSCHDPQHAFADPRPQSMGALANRVGTRNAPSLMYSALIPPFAFDEFFTPDGDEIYAFEGGLFWDGRARDLFEQVQQPFLNTNEMNLGDEKELASRLRQSAYANELKELTGAHAWEEDTMVTYQAYLTLVDFLQSPTFRPFDSKLDAYQSGDHKIFSAAEKRGMKVYVEKAKCNDCHPLTARHWERPLLSDFGYDNLGVPSSGKLDPGLGKHTGNADEIGQFRSPSLRNVSLTAPYMHNGSLKTLREVVEFYNSRDTPQSRWTKTDYPNTVNRNDLGNLQLTEQEVQDLVTFLNCFTDQCLNESRLEKRFPRPPFGTPSSESKALYFPGWTHRLHPGYRTAGDTIPPFSQ